MWQYLTASQRILGQTPSRRDSLVPVPQPRVAQNRYDTYHHQACKQAHTKRDP
jgi:hypothetical protein